MYDGMAHGDLEVIADVRVEDHYIHALDLLAFPRHIV